MNKAYEAPHIVDYGTIASVTGETGTSAATDWFLTRNGDLIQRGHTGSIDGCAQEAVGGMRKCICADNGTCV